MFEAVHMGADSCSMQASKSSSEHFTAVGKLSAEVFTGQQPARGRRWLDEIVTASQPSRKIVARESCSVARSLALLVKAAIEDRLPRGLGVARLCDSPAEWSRQYRMQRLEAGLCGPAKSRVLGEQQEISFSAGVRGGPVGFPMTFYLSNGLVS